MPWAVKGRGDVRWMLATLAIGMSACAAAEPGAACGSQKTRDALAAEVDQLRRLVGGHPDDTLALDLRQIVIERSDPTTSRTDCSAEVYLGMPGGSKVYGGRRVAYTITRTLDAGDRVAFSPDEATALAILITIDEAT